MSGSSDWLRWPTNSSDPTANAAIAVFLAMVAIVLVVVGGMFLLPVVAVIGVAKVVHWYANRPTPTDQLYAVTQQRSVTANFPAPDQFIEAYLERFIDAIRDDLPAYSVFAAMTSAAEAIYKAENLNNPLPPLAAANAIEEGRYRDQLIAHQRKTADAPRTLEVFNATLGKSCLDFIAALPPIARTNPDIFAQCEEVETFATFPLIDMLPDAAGLIMPLIVPFFREEIEELGLFAGLRKQLDRNFAEASGIDYPAANHKLITPDKFEGTPREAVSAYLGGTPLEALFYAEIPFALTDQQRYEHMHVVGGSGHGKTQLLQRLIVEDLRREQPPALVIIDSQGEMLGKLQKLDLFGPGQPLADRIAVIDPEDVDYPPALNMFDLRPARFGDYSQAIKEQIEASTIETFNYVFGALAAELTSRQNTTFAFVTRLMLAIPGATIHTLRELFEDGATSMDASPFAEHIRKLDPTSQAYFENQFFTKTYSQTKQQIARRLYSVLQVPAFERMFASQTNKLDLFDALQAGAIVLINTSKALLKSDASALFGRYMIARVIAAAFERIALSAAERKPAFLIVDEAAEYFDDNLETLLSQARKYNVGVLFAHQHLDQLTPALRAAVAANTSIKLAGGVSDKDARALAADMRTTPDFLAGMAKHAKATDFACYVRNYTANAVRLTIPFGALEAAAKMTAEDHSRLIAVNRQRYAAGRDEPRPVAYEGEHSSPTAVPVPAAAETAISDDWRS
jgi:Type IV secretion-system coupling protein DNA-binding domain